jgi:GT2 family glycosyltransferase
MTDSVPVSVVIPTIGRPPLLAECLRSLERCVPRAAEIVVIDQSADGAVAEVVDEFTAVGARVLPLPGRNIARGRNVGLREARHDIVLFTDDDCTVPSSWIGTAMRLMTDDSERIVTGKVLAAGPDVPSIRYDARPHEHTGELRCDALYTGNMAARRAALLEFGGFDERLAQAAEDNDLCYRWLRAGRRLTYEPELVVEHGAWRTPADVARTYDSYWRGQGAFYAKHLRRGDTAVLRFLVSDLNAGVRAGASDALGRAPRTATAPRLRALALGLLTGLRRRSVAPMARRG